MIFNEIADRGALNQVLMRRLNMTGSAPAPSLMPEIAPTLTLENDRPEWSYLKAENRFSGAINIAAVVAERSIVWVPPIGQNQVAVIQDIAVSAGATQIFYIDGRSIAPSITIPITASNPNHIDDRNNDAAPWTWLSGTNAAIPGVNRRWATVRVPANTTIQVNGPFVLTNRNGLVIHTAFVNVAADLYIRGYYRAALPGELV